MGLNHANWIPEFVALSDGNENDRIQGRKLTFSKGSIVAFDKGYNDYGWFKELTDQKVSFVTRILTNSVYDVIESHSVISTKGIISNRMIQFSSIHTKKKEVPNLRQV